MRVFIFIFLNECDGSGEYFFLKMFKNLNRKFKIKNKYKVYVNFV